MKINAMDCVSYKSEDLSFNKKHICYIAITREYKHIMLLNYNGAAFFIDKKTFNILKKNLIEVIYESFSITYVNIDNIKSIKKIYKDSYELEFSHITTKRTLCTIREESAKKIYRLKNLKILYESI